MHISKSYQIELCSTRQDGLRPVLQHVMVERLAEPTEDLDGMPCNGSATSANGFMLASVPVVLDDDDVPGLVRWDAFREARRHSNNGVCLMKLLADRIEYGLGVDMWTMPRLTHGVTLDAKWPDYLRIVSDLKIGRVFESAIYFDPTLAFRLNKAIGRPFFIVAHISSKNQAMLIQGKYGYDATGRPKLPFGLLMPVAGSAAPDGVKAEDAVVMGSPV